MEEEYPDIAVRLRKLRTIAKFGHHGGQKAFAEKLGVEPGTFSSWENTGQIPWPDAAKYRRIWFKLDLIERVIPYPRYEGPLCDAGDPCHVIIERARTP